MYEDIFSPELRKNDWNVVAFVAPWCVLSSAAILDRNINLTTRDVAMIAYFVTLRLK